MSARARAGGALKALLVDGEASFSTQGTIKDGHPVAKGDGPSRVAA